jgi:hypothetical protein
VPQDTLITLRRFTDAFGAGVHYELTISSDGTVVFKRFRNPFVAGFDPKAPPPKPIRTMISVEKVAELIAEFGRINYFSLKDRYARIEDGCPGVWTDQAGAETSITINGKTKTIDHYYGCVGPALQQTYPLELTRLEGKIDEVVGTYEWLQ